MPKDTNRPQSNTLLPWNTEAGAYLTIVVLSILAALPPQIVGTSSSALTVQALEHWSYTSADAFAATHFHWIWLPRLLMFLGDAVLAMIVTKVIFFALGYFFLYRTARRFTTRENSFWLLVGTALSVAVLYTEHTSDIANPAFLVGALTLYLFSHARYRSLGVLVLGLAFSVSVKGWPFFVVLAWVSAQLAPERAEEVKSHTVSRIGLFLIGVASWVLLGLFFLGANEFWAFITMPEFHAPQTSSFAHALFRGLFAFNALLVFHFLWAGRRPIANVVLVAMIAACCIDSMVVFGVGCVTMIPASLLLLTQHRHFRIAAPAFAACNLVLFLVTPVFENNPQVWLPKDHRVADISETEFNYNRNDALHGLNAIRQKDTVEQEARRMLRDLAGDSLLIVTDGSTMQWLDAGTLAAILPGKKTSWFYGTPINWMRANGLKDTVFIRPALRSPELVAVFDKSYARQFLDSAVATTVERRETNHLRAYLLTTEDDRKRLLDRLIEIHYHSFH